jgi:hypothetical protein
VTLTSAEHARVHQETKRDRNARARERREVELLSVVDAAGGQTLTVAVSRSEPHRGYLLRRTPDGSWTCGCPGFRFRASCSHVRAARQWEEAQQAALSRAGRSGERRPA